MENKTIRILAIDDNRDNLTTIKAIISEVIPQSIVFTEENGYRGIESARHNLPDVILLDILMPDMDGYQVCRKLKSDPNLSEIPVIFLTALSGDKQSRILALEAGGDAFLAKPIDAIELKAQILAMYKVKEAAAYKQTEKANLEELVQKRTEEIRKANIATLNLLEDLKKENLERKKSEAALRESEKKYAFLAGTAFELVKLTSLQSIYEYTARKLFELMEEHGIITVVEYNTDSNRWVMKHIVGIQDKLKALTRIFGFDVRKLEGEISTKYYNKVLSGKLVEIAFDLQGLFNSKISDTIETAVKKLLSIEKLLCISIQGNEKIFGNITILLKKGAKPLNAELIEAFILQVTNFVRKQTTEEVLKASEIKFRTLVDQASEMLFLHDLDGNLIEVSENSIKATGYSREELAKMNVLDIDPDSHNRDDTHKYWLSIEPSDPPVTFESRHRRKNGSIYPVEVTISKVEYLGSQYMLGLARDISERKLAEEKLKLLNRAVDASSVSVVITDAMGVINYVNPYFSHLTGYSYNEVLGENPRVLSSGYQSKGFYRELWNTILSGKDWTGEFQNRKKNGDLFWEKAVISPILDSNGEVINFVAIKEDITEKKRFDETQNFLLEISQLAALHISVTSFLAEVHKKLKKIIRSDNFYVAVYNKINHTFSFPYHVDEYDSIEMHAAYDLSNSYTDYVFKTDQSLIVQPGSHPEFGVDAGVKEYGDQQSVWLGVPFRAAESDKPTGVIGIQDYHNTDSYTETDLTIMEIIAHSIGSFIERINYMEELVKARNKAEESDRLKTAFLANMSHEIRTPMNGILGFAYLLKEPDLSITEQKSYIEIIEKSGKRMLNIINDIVDISKIEAGLMNINLSESNIHEQIKYIYTFFRPEVEEKGIEFGLKCQLNSDEVIIHTDREKVFAILTNLVKNAIKFTHKGAIELGCLSEKSASQNQNELGEPSRSEVGERSGLRIYVKDTGIGIPKDRQEAIFERFVQADIEDKMAYQGAGLGLSITKSYVEMLGGKIWLESELGIGSTFYFTLPNVARVKNNSDQEPFPSLQNDIFKKLKILVAEDEEISEKLVESYVKKISKHILYARTGKEAVEICRENPDIDMIMMDIRMPVIGGFEAARQIREFNKEVVIIAQTACCLKEDREKAISSGCNDYLTKPIDKMELLAIIRKYFVNIQP